MALKNISSQPTSGVVTPRANDAAVAKSAKSGDIAAGAPAVQNSSTSKKGVDVNVSDAAKARALETKKAKELAMKSPEVREDKVAAIKAKIADGTYQVDSQKIAEGMVKESLMEHLASESNQ